MAPLREPIRLNLIGATLIIGFIAFVIYLIFFIDISVVLETLSRTNLSIYLMAFSAYIAYTLCSSLAWHSLLGSLSVKITRWKAFLFTWAGLFFDATVPQLGWSAEVSKTYMLSKDSNVDLGKVGASVVGQKIIAMTITIIALSLGLILLLFRYSFPLFETFLICLVLVLSILFLTVVYLVSLKPSATDLFLTWLVKVVSFFRKSWSADNFRLKANEMLGSFHDGIARLKAKPSSLVVPVVFSVVGFVFEASVLFIAFAAIGEAVSVDVVLIVFTLTGTLQTVGLTFFGFPELIMSVVLGQLGISLSIAVSVAVLTRLVNLWFRLILSYGLLQWTGIKILTKEKK